MRTSLASGPRTAHYADKRLLCCRFLRGGSRLSGGRRGSAAQVDLASDLLALETQLTWIWLYRLDLHSTVDTIPSMLPPTVTRLTLENDGITAFDVDVAGSFPRLEQL